MSSYRCQCGFEAFVNLGKTTKPEYRCYVCHQAERNPGFSGARISKQLLDYLKQEKERYDSTNKRTKVYSTVDDE